MGGGTKYITVIDDSNIMVFPSTLVDYGNQAKADNLAPNSAGNLGEFGINYALNSTMVLHVYGGNLTSFQFGSIGPAFDSGAPDAATIGEFDDAQNESSNFKGSVGFAMKTGSLDLGFMLSMYSDSTGSQVGTNSTTRSPLGISGGVGLGMDLGSSHLDAALFLEFGSMSSTVAGDADFSGDGHTGVGFVTRMFIPAAPGVTAIPYMSVGYLSSGIVRESDEVLFSGTSLTFDIGADLRIEPAQDIFIHAGVGVRYETTENVVNVDGDATSATTDNGLYLPYLSLAVDAKITKWLDWRLGGVHLNVKELTKTDVGDEDATQATSFAAADVRFTTGFGMHFSDWTIDLNVHPRFFTDGPYIWTGNQTPWAVDAALKYVW